ncbi:PREDICTED: E3 ubiquitin-protein ligase FANCL isoform X2 [Nicrophorus vespilloides]|uniref:E3 ubiquitin-protein ligase FANCL isoform X2 n=1 Tax=Nicrophorus vespilloides TaxID=110193 RepID=A0ABM1N4J0_NICVS|nr:PREDICTED: E3 ubiquitin-protein ligase FANCL isoform X2 [Nicrophorus vespilloides]
MSTKALDLELFLNYPGIIPLSKSNDEFGGYLFDAGFPISLKKDKDRRRYDVQLGRVRSEVLAGVDFGEHPALILRKLSEFIGKSADGDRGSQENNDTDFYRFVMREYVEFKKFYFNIGSKLSHDMRCIEILHVDESRRQHKLQIEVKSDCKAAFNAKIYDLPECELQDDNSLLSLYGKFCEVVALYQPFFDLLDEIDDTCWILDPETPKRKDAYRRIAITGNLSVVIQFNAKNFVELPILKFLGPKHECEEYSKKLTANFSKWEPEDQILQEILKLLELEAFPKKPVKASLEELVLVNSGECCICFTMRLDDKLPEIVCPNPCCSQLFHEQCLYQWLFCLNSRKFYFEIIGDCPNCEKLIRCPLPKN